MSRGFSRRDFLKASAAVAGTFALAGPLIRNKPAYGQAANEKIRFAFVGTGGRAGAHTGLAKNNVCIAYCDPDKTHWGFCAQNYPQAKSYTDYRKLFDEVGSQVDAVTVATPDHHHAPASARALRLGKAVYCEKPLTWSIEEARTLATLAAEKKVATQMGNQGHSNQGNRRIVEWIRAGVIGDVTEIHTWTNRPIWPQGHVNKGTPAAPPADFDYESWLGAAKFRPYTQIPDGKDKNGNPKFKHPAHPFAWRGWFDYGCGAVGDMGCHTWDSVFWSMAPDYPTLVELEKIVEADPDCFAKQSVTRWEFPAKGERKAFKAWWYEGGLKPPVPDEIANDPDRDPKDRKLAGSGNLYIGTKGKLLVTGDYGDSASLVPLKAMNEFKAGKFKEIEKLPPSPGHHEEWLMAIRGQKPWNFPGSNFAEYAGPLTESMLLAVIAQKIGQVGFKIECDPVKREIKTREALALRGRQYRTGWEL